MNMFARFDGNPAMTLQDIKEKKRYGRTDARTHARTHRQRENSLPTSNKVCGGGGIIKFSLKQKKMKHCFQDSMGSAPKAEHIH